MADIGVNSTYQSMVNSECSSCEIGADKSAYWTPLLYYWYPNGSFYEVPHSGSVVYYLARGPNANSTVPFPEGLQILSGNKAARSYDNETLTWGNATYPGRPIADRVSFACLTAGPLPPNQPYIYNVTSCVNGMRGQIAFQSCWNGVDLYKTDNSHVAYLSSIDNGICPPGYPIQFPTLFVETDYGVANVPNGTDDSRFVFSQGDPTGFGFHGDFINGWEMDVQTAAVDNCLVPDNFGQISYCPALYASDSSGYPENCPERPPQIDEQVHGLLEKLPGCVNVTYGPDEATAADMECPPTVAQPSIIQTADSTPFPTASPSPGAQFGLPDQEYMGCYNDSYTSGFRTLNEIMTVNYTVMTVEYCQQFCIDHGYRLSGVEYAQECHCDNEINPTALNANNSTTNQCTWRCGGTMTTGGTQELCGGVGYIDVYRNTNSSFVAFGNNDNTAGDAQGYTPAGGYGSNYLGCYSDPDAAARTLTGIYTDWSNMTVEICAAFCMAGNGYQYYGLEYGSQCYCRYHLSYTLGTSADRDTGGNFITSPGTLLTLTSSPANTSCEMRCQGSEPEICGGASVLSMYNNTAYAVPQTKPSVGKYKTQQCLLDPNDGSGRALQGSILSGPDMTVEVCTKYCLGNYYHYAGVEYGEECYCKSMFPWAGIACAVHQADLGLGGNEIAYDAGAALAVCNVTDQMLCAGSAVEYCGGPGFMNVYYSATL